MQVLGLLVAISGIVIAALLASTFRDSAYLPIIFGAPICCAGTISMLYASIMAWWNHG